MSDDENVIPLQPGKGGRHPSKGAGKGAGWGGPAKGAGRGADALIPSQPPEKVAMTHANRVRGEKLAEEMYDKLATLARNAEREETQLSATVALLNRIEGTPIQRNLNAEVDSDQIERGLTVKFIKPNAG